MRRAVITILGTIGGKFDPKKKEFVFEEKTNKSFYYSTDNIIDIKDEKYINTLPLFIKNFDCAVIPIFTKDAKKIQLDVLDKLEDIKDKKDIFKDDYLIEDEQDFEKIFNMIHNIINNPEYDRFVIDVTHGFRHLPLLMLIELMIVHFQDTSKIEKILFAKEDEKPTKENNFVGKYNFIDLKEYLLLANISFVLTTFEKNYTVANHIKSEKYQNLIDALNNFSNDLMALNLNNLFDNSVTKLEEELEKIDDISIKKQANKLKEHITTTFKKRDKRYLTYYFISKELFKKNYMLISLSLLNESLRLYIKTTIKKEHSEIVEKIEHFYYEDLYKIGNFFVKLYTFNATHQEYMFKIYNNVKNFTYERGGEKLESILSEEEFSKIINSFPIKLKEQIEFNGESKILVDHIGHKRNNLAHANSSTVSFDSIHDDIKEFIKEFEARCILSE